MGADQAISRNEQDERYTRATVALGPALVSAAVVVAVFSGVWWLNLRGARRLQRMIDDL